MFYISSSAKYSNGKISDIEITAHYQTCYRGTETEIEEFFGADFIKQLDADLARVKQEVMLYRKAAIAARYYQEKENQENAHRSSASLSDQVHQEPQGAQG